jgi:hypothetical protein
MVPSIADHGASPIWGSMRNLGNTRFEATSNMVGDAQVLSDLMGQIPLDEVSVQVMVLRGDCSAQCSYHHSGAEKRVPVERKIRRMQG